LTSALRAADHRVVRIVRRAPSNADEVFWNPDAGEFDPNALRGVDAVVNLCGVNVGAKRWSGAFKQSLRDSRIGPTEVRDRYGVEPKQVPDFIALRGDPSDKLPGAKGVGPKTAASLLAQYTSLEAMLEEGRFSTQADELRLYKRIASMDADAPLPELPDAQPDWQGGAKLVRSWGLNAVADRLEGRAQSTS
jgi:hypothetical protein